MKNLEISQMELVSGGSGCSDSAVGLGLTFAGAFLIGTGAGAPIGAALFAVSFVWGSISLANSCSEQ